MFVNAALISYGWMDYSLDVVPKAGFATGKESLIGFRVG
jgi:hypothetical protein